jgi:hypothetical protein
LAEVEARSNFAGAAAEQDTAGDGASSRVHQCSSSVDDNKKQIWNRLVTCKQKGASALRWQFDTRAYN